MEEEGGVGSYFLKFLYWRIFSYPKWRLLWYWIHLWFWEVIFIRKNLKSTYFIEITKKKISIKGVDLHKNLIYFTYKNDLVDEPLVVTA